MHQASGSPYGSQINAAPIELQQSWQSVDQFRQFLDSLETQIKRAEALQHNNRNLLFNAQRPQRKRNLLLRLLMRGGS